MRETPRNFQGNQLEGIEKKSLQIRNCIRGVIGVHYSGPGRQTQQRGWVHGRSRRSSPGCHRGNWRSWCWSNGSYRNSWSCSRCATSRPPACGWSALRWPCHGVLCSMIRGARSPRFDPRLRRRGNGKDSHGNVVLYLAVSTPSIC